MPRRPARALRLLRYYLLRFTVGGLPVAWWLLAIGLLWFADWVSGGRAWQAH